ncbi:hypothetical protein PAFU01_40290 [Pantoea ananatis]|nr:hypothetical protein PAFU01_40290 [Pantoea ananatis]
MLYQTQINTGPEVRSNKPMRNVRAMRIKRKPLAAFLLTRLNKIVSVPKRAMVCTIANNDVENAI